VDLSALANLNRMANTPDSRDFYRVSRVVLMPSLWRESLGRVAMEASVEPEMAVRRLRRGTQSKTRRLEAVPICEIHRSKLCLFLSASIGEISRRTGLHLRFGSQSASFGEICGRT